MIVLKGKRFSWNRLTCTVTRVARDGSWADLKVVDPFGGSWSKRQPLPFPDSFVEIRDGGK